MGNVAITLPKFHDGQRRLWESRRRFNVGRSGRRWGKTVHGLRLAAEDSLQGWPVGWFAPTYKLLDEAWARTIKRLSPIIRRKDASVHRLELVTGGVLDFWTMHDPDCGRGRRYKRVILDEAAMARNLEAAWNEAIRPTLTDLKGDAWIFSTPKRGKQPGGRYFRKLCENAERFDDWRHFTAPTWDNPHIPPEEVEAARNELPELVFRQEYGAEFVDLDSILMRQELLRYAPAPSEMTISLGVDLAISEKQTADWTAIAAMGRHMDGRRFVLDVQRERCGFHGAVQFIKRMAEKWKPRAIAIEEVQYQAAVTETLLRETSLPVRGVRPERDKVTRFMPLVNRYEKGLVYHVPGLPPVFEDELLSFPEGEFLDQVDALVYADMALDSYSGGGYAVGGSRTF